MPSRRAPSDPSPRKEPAPPIPPAPVPDPALVSPPIPLPTRRRARKTPGEAACSQPWMENWLRAAAGSNSVVETCNNAGVSLAQYLEGRRTDLAFDTGCRVFDQIVDLTIVESVRHHAIHGDPRAQGLYFKTVRAPSFAPPFAIRSSTHLPAPPAPPTSTQALPPSVADAMIRAGLAELERSPD